MIHYELKLEGNEEIKALLEKHMPEKFNTRAEMNAKYRAIIELFGDEVKVKLFSISRRVRRRVLKV